MNTECVILAAGLSSRTGTNKMLLEIKNEPVIEHCISAFYSTCSKIFVVTGCYHEEIAKVLSKYDKIHIIYNEFYRDGMFSSVKAGLKEIKTERFFLTPGDYPLLKKDTINYMLQKDGDFLAPTFGEIQGHPILLKSKLINYILSSKSLSLRECLNKVPKKELEVDDIGIITDLDTISDYENMKKTFES